MFAISHDLFQVQELETYLDPSASYVLAKETTKSAHKETQGQHFHAYVEMTDKQYDSFRKTILVKKYNLSGQARNGKPRQYGRIKSIKDETKMLQYTCKDNNLITRNIDLEKIQEAIKNSYKKQDRKDFITEMMDYLGKTTYQEEQEQFNGQVEWQFKPRLVEYQIIKYYIENKINKPVSKATLRSLTTRYMMYHTTDADIDDIYAYIMYN